MLGLSLLAQLVGPSSHLYPAVSGHSHNDYAQAEPLSAALRGGMVSVEADLYWVDGALLVGHSRGELSADRDFDTLYWLPLTRARSRKDPVELLIDIKSEPDQIVPMLFKRLEHGPASVLMVLSGKRPSTWPSHPNLTVEGTVQELLSGKLPKDCRYVSGQWRQFFDWDGDGAMPSEQFAALKHLVDLAHSSGLKLRLWGSPDGPASWAIQFAAGVDRINTDRPEELGTWLAKAKVP